MVDNLLGVVEQEATKEHQTPVHVDGVEPGEDGRARGSKQTSWGSEGGVTDTEGERQLTD